MNNIVKLLHKKFGINQSKYDRNYIEFIHKKIKYFTIYFRYYFPMSENDSFLYNLDVTSDEESDVENLTEVM